MSQIIVWRCDSCGTTRCDLPKSWEAVPTWEDGSVTKHYCAKCQRRRSR